MIQTIIAWIQNLVGTFLGGLAGKVGSWLMSVAVTFLEAKFPGLTPIINQIVAWLGMGVPPAQIAQHLLNAKFEIKP